MPEVFIMICVGIDVAKNKHDCFILNSEGEVLADVFTIQNNAEGYDTLLQTIKLTGVEPLPPVSAPFRRFLPFSL